MILYLFAFLSGVGLFLYGMELLGGGLQQAAGARLQKVLQSLTGVPVMGVLLGALVAATLQSSAATTVMSVGLVNAGVMTLKQAFSVVMGANIGTTLTAQLIAFNLTEYFTVMIFIGVMIRVFAKRKKIPDIRLTQLGQWCCVAIFIAIAVAFQLYCIRHLPAIDFSDWKKGNDVVKAFIEQPAKKESSFIYRSKADGSEVTLSETELMEKDMAFYDNYDYVDRKDKEIAPGVKAEIDGFNMLDENGADHAYEFINTDGKVYLLFIHDLKEVKAKGLDKVRALVTDCDKRDIPFVAVTNSDEEELAAFIDKYQIDFPVYRNPIDPAHGPFMVRDAIRSNPGLIFIDKGVVVDKWGWRDIPQQCLD